MSLRAVGEPRGRGGLCATPGPGLLMMLFLQALLSLSGCQWISGLSELQLASCGNGKLEAGEYCDGDCPVTCAEVDSCLHGTLVGTPAQCDARCEYEVIATGEGHCCVDDVDASLRACLGRCGDGILDPGELCERCSEDDEHCASACPTACAPSADPCQVPTLVGSAATCDARCEQAAITLPMDGDGCCPAGADADSDRDCSARCGNGILEAGERCERCGGDACDAPCPITCDDQDPCTIDRLVGSAASCDAYCETRPRAASLQQVDGCCPAGADATSDSDCEPLCGNGVRERGEDCDGDCDGACYDARNACSLGELQLLDDGCRVRCEVVCRVSPQCGCAEDETCHPTAPDRRSACVVDGTLAEGEACGAFGACSHGLGCYGGLCRRYCATSADCSTGGRCLAAVRFPPDITVGTVADIAVCSLPCDPAADPTAACLAVNTTCHQYASGLTDCSAAGLGKQHAPCRTHLDCRQRYACARSAEQSGAEWGQCARYCDHAAGETCRHGLICERVGQSSRGLCQGDVSLQIEPWFEMWTADDSDAADGLWVVENEPVAP